MSPDHQADVPPPAYPMPTVPVQVISAIDPILRDAAIGDLLLDIPGCAALRHEIDVRSARLRRVVMTTAGVLEDQFVELDHPCVSCAMREDAVLVLAHLATRPDIHAIALAPPISAEPAVVVSTLLPHQDGWHLSGVLTVLSATTLLEDLLGEDTLAGRGLQWAAEDERGVGEALAAQIEYADLLLVDRAADGAAESTADSAFADAAGRELLEHLRAPQQQVIDGLHSLDGTRTLRGTLDHEAGTRRRDPRHVNAGHGPSIHGTWTVDLSSPRPFHPERFLDNIELLGGGPVRGRGRFWVPDRPGTICHWDGAGGQVTIGPLLDADGHPPSTHLVITGIRPEDAVRVREAFARSLLTDEEWAAGPHAWQHTRDLLEPWLGARDADHVLRLEDGRIVD